MAVQMGFCCCDDDGVVWYGPYDISSCCNDLWIPGSVNLDIGGPGWTSGCGSRCGDIQGVYSLPLMSLSSSTGDAFWGIWLTGFGSICDSEWDPPALGVGLSYSCSMRRLTGNILYRDGSDPLVLPYTAVQVTYRRTLSYLDGCPTDGTLTYLDGYTQDTYEEMCDGQPADWSWGSTISVEGFAS